MNYLFTRLTALSAALLLGWSCDKNTLTLPIESATSGARVKLIHAAPEAPGVDLLIGGKKYSGFTPAGASVTSPGTPVPITYTRTFPAFDFDYAVVPAGASEVSITAPATTTASSATVISTQNLTLDDNKYYSMILAGAGAKPDVLLLNDDFSTATDPAKFYVRFINLLVGGPELDLALVKGAVLQSKIGYKGASSFIGLNVANGASFEIRPTGTSTVLLPASTTSNSAGRVLTVILTGISGKTGAVAPRAFFYVSR